MGAVVFSGVRLQEGLLLATPIRRLLSPSMSRRPHGPAVEGVEERWGIFVGGMFRGMFDGFFRLILRRGGVREHLSTLYGVL